jgi:hypothetical protein
MKTPLFQFLALVGMAVAATSSIENARHLRRALEESDAILRAKNNVPAAIQSMENDDFESTEDDPPDRRNLGRCRKPATLRPKKPGRRDLGKLRYKTPPAIQANEDDEKNVDDDLAPTEEMIELVGKLDDDEDSETAEDDPPGNGRDLFGRLPRCRSRCVRNGCRRNGRRFDCCQAYSGGYVAC